MDIARDGAQETQGSLLARWEEKRKREMELELEHERRTRQLPFLFGLRLGPPSPRVAVISVEEAERTCSPGLFLPCGNLRQSAIEAPMSLPMPGTLLLVRGERTGWLRRESLPVQLLTSEPNSGIVHVCLFWEPEGLETLPVEIGFVPMVAKTFEKSIVEIVGLRPVGTDWWDSLQEWRLRKAEGLTGGFVLSLSEIRRLTWETVHERQPDASRENLYLEFAYPLAAGPKQPMRGIRVATMPRIPPIPLP
jgi:hypothetical protein